MYIVTHTVAGDRRESLAHFSINLFPYEKSRTSFCVRIGIIKFSSANNTESMTPTQLCFKSSGTNYK